MLPRNPLLQLVPARAASVLERLRSLVWTAGPEITDISGTAPQPDFLTWEQAKREKLSPVTLPHHWGKLFDQAWFRIRLTDAPKGFEFFEWRDQGEATVYLDGVPYAGIDVAHHRCRLPEGVKELWIESSCIQSGIWHSAASGIDPQGSRLLGARWSKRHEAAWEAWHDFEVLYDVMREELKAQYPGESFAAVGPRPPIQAATPLLRRLLRYLDAAMDAWDRSGLPAMRKVLREAYRELPAEPIALKASLTGHAHIDLVWMWPENVGEFKARHTFATALQLMEQYPEFRFGYSQPASYRAVERSAPKLFERVKQRIRKGSWEALGATEVESDTLLACGEALARSFLLGQETFREMNGEPSRTLWLPDVFGYAGCLPQLMRESGVDRFFTTKLTWSAITQFPHSSFIWRGSDGSEVLSHVTHAVGYNGTVNVEELRKGALNYRQSDEHDEFLAPTGYGDGGGGVTPEMCERARRLGDLAGSPKASWSRVDDFFEGLEAVRAKLPVYQGELYLQYHRGTFTTHGDVKDAFRGCERALQAWEAARCASSGEPIARCNWERLVFAQFHDYIPGSSLHEVYDEGKVELLAIAQEALATATVELAGEQGKGAALFNPLTIPRIEMVRDETDELLPVLLPPLAGRPLAHLQPIQNLPRVRTASKRLENGIVHAEFDRTGQIRSLTVRGCSIAVREPLNQLILYPDRPHRYDAWDIDRQTLSLGEVVQGGAEIEVEEDSAARGCIAFRRKVGSKSSVVVRYSLDAGSTVLRIDYQFDWQEEGYLVKAVFPTDYRGRFARYGAPFGSVTRPQQPGSLADEAMWEVPASRWAAVCDEGELNGLMIVTEAKYGFTCRDGSMGVSLIRSAKITCEEHKDTGAFPVSLRRTMRESQYSDVGEHHIRLAIGRYNAAAQRGEQPAALADALYTQNIPYQGGPRDCGFLGLYGGETLHATWAKPLAKGRWILRLNETLGHRGVARLALMDGWTARRANLLDEVAEEAEIISEVPFRPYELITLQIERNE
jgi:alpha-mannosidase